MIERFTIRDTEAGFAAWLQDYGEVSDPNGFSMYLSKGDAPNRDPWLVVYTSFGNFRLTIAKVAPGRLTATVDLGESVSDELKTYVAALIVAIRREYTDVAGLTDLERFYLKAVRELPKERGRLDDYCARVGVTDQTLRNWRKRFIEMGLEVD